MRAVLDPNVLISALLAPKGTPAKLVRRWLDGEFEIVVSELLLAELTRALAYPKIRSRVPKAEAEAFVDLLRAGASLRVDPEARSLSTRDPGDDHLLALAADSAAVLVSGDQDLLTLKGVPVESPTAFLARL